MADVSYAEDTVLTVPEVADRLRCSRAFVYKLARTGQLPRMRGVGGKVLFSAAAFDAWWRKARGDRR